MKPSKTILIAAVVSIVGPLGTGIYSQIMNEFISVEGSRVELPVHLKASEFYGHIGRNVLKTLEITVVIGRELPNGGKNMMWHVSEFLVRCGKIEAQLP